jgi:hypothetical protein
LITIQLEHAIRDFGMWKGAFDADPIDRAALGVRRHQVFRPVDDPNYVMVELDFGTTEEAEACRVALEGLWKSAAAAPALVGAPKVRIIESVEEIEYESLGTSRG